MKTARACWWLLLLLLGGCVRIEQTIFLNEDGSGRLVEKVWVSDWVFQTAGQNQERVPFQDLLQAGGLRERLASYGAVTLVSHTVTNRGGNGVEACTVLAFTNIDDVRLPLLLSGGTNRPGAIAFTLGGKQRQDLPTFTGWHYSVSRPLRISLPPRGSSEAAPMTPAEKTQWARLLPVMRAMSRDFRITARLEAYGAVNGRPSHTLYEITGQDLAAGDAAVDLLLRGELPDSGAAGDLRRGGYTVSIAEPFEPEDRPAGR